MGLGDKIRNSAKKFRGGGKPALGETNRDRNLRAEGKHSGADLKHVGERIKDAFRKH